MTYNTGNLVPSTDPRDLDDNSQAFDRFLQSTSASEPDRLGQLRKTWYQMEQDAATLVSPNVAALAALTAASDKGVFFSASGPVAMGTYTLNSFNRSLGSTADQPAFRAAIGAMALTDTGAYAGSAAKLTTARSLTATGDATWTVSFDGSANSTAAISLAASGVGAGTYGSVTVNAKGLVTSASTATPIANGGTAATTAAGARTNLGVRNTSTTYIEGLEATWGASSVSISPGSAYIPSLGRTVESTAAIVVTLTGLTSGTFYHLYLFESAGVASVELSATAPLLTATGGYIKTGDTSRRYLESVLASGTTAVYRFVQIGGKMLYNVAGGNSPHQVLSGTASTATTVSCNTVVPLTGVSMGALCSNTAAATTVRIGNSDLGTVSNSNARLTLSAGNAMEHEVWLDGSQAFSYIFDASQGNPLIVRALSYSFRR